jgi:hypothetical protein
MRKYELAIGDDGQVVIEHDDFTGPELAAFAIILQSEATEVLKNGPIQHVQIRSPNGSD